MTARLRRNTAKALAEYQVSGLALLKDVVVFTARVLAITYPHIDEVPDLGDHPELASARQLLDDCGHLLRSIEDHWKQVAVRLPNGHPAKTKHDDDDDPF
jgi:hypothetical protein